MSAMQIIDSSSVMVGGAHGTGATGIGGSIAMALTPDTSRVKAVMESPDMFDYNALDEEEEAVSMQQNSVGNDTKEAKDGHLEPPVLCTGAVTSEEMNSLSVNFVFITDTLHGFVNQLERHVASP